MCIILENESRWCEIIQRRHVAFCDKVTFHEGRSEDGAMDKRMMKSRVVLAEIHLNMMIPNEASPLERMCVAKAKSQLEKATGK